MMNRLRVQRKNRKASSWFSAVIILIGTERTHADSASRYPCSRIVDRISST
jgi:hypothetical protein